MTSALTRPDAPPGGFALLAPERQTLPLVLASPHSGRAYPPDFVASSALDPVTLRRSEDSFVEVLFAAAPRLGAPLLHALFPRAYCDPNREPFELDPGMFEDPLPPFANTRSPRVAAGLGTIARVVASGAEIYGRKLRYADVQARIETCYRPYHAALRRLVDETVRQFGFCILVDCHSMPSSGAAAGDGLAGAHGPATQAQAGFVLGDCFGTACAPAITAAAERCLARRRYRVVRNDPYAGGFTTRHYGRPQDRTHALQIEVNRGLYMDEAALAPTAQLPALAGHLAELIAALGALEPRDLGH